MAVGKLFCLLEAQHNIFVKGTTMNGIECSGFGTALCSIISLITTLVLLMNTHESELRKPSMSPVQMKRSWIVDMIYY